MKKKISFIFKWQTLLLRTAAFEQTVSGERQRSYGVGGGGGGCWCERKSVESWNTEFVHYSLFLSFTAKASCRYLILHEFGVTAIDLHLLHLLLPLLCAQSSVGLQHLDLLLQIPQTALQRADLRVLQGGKDEREREREESMLLEAAWCRSQILQVRQWVRRPARLVRGQMLLAQKYKSRCVWAVRSNEITEELEVPYFGECVWAGKWAWPHERAYNGILFMLTQKRRGNLLRESSVSQYK